MSRKRFSCCYALLLLLVHTHLTVHAFAPPARSIQTTIRPSQKKPLSRRRGILITTTTTTTTTTTCPLVSHARPRTCLHLSPSSSSLSWWYMTLLAFQFGAQPILTKKYTPKTICRSTVVMSQEVVRFVAAAIFLGMSGSWTSSLTDWSVRSWLMVAGLPAILYAVQNYCTLMAYQNLPPITFNVLNQTKTLSAALCCYLIMGKKQSSLQIVSLFLLLLSALVIEKVVPLKSFTKPRVHSTTTASVRTEVSEARRLELMSGVLPVLLASFLSGLAGALSQQSLQTVGRNSYLFTMELCAASLVVMTSSLLLFHGSPDARSVRTDGFFHNWTMATWIPVATNALGGIVVGLVTKYAGSVRKGFALIFGLMISGILQSKATTEGITTEQMVGGMIAAVSLWMHCNFPIVVT